MILVLVRDEHNIWIRIRHREAEAFPVVRIGKDCDIVSTDLPAAVSKPSYSNHAHSLKSYFIVYRGVPV